MAKGCAVFADEQTGNKVLILNFFLVLVFFLIGFCETSGGSDVPNRVSF